MQVNKLQIIGLMLLICTTITAFAQKQTDIVYTAVLKSADMKAYELSAENILSSVKNEITRNGYSADDMSRFAVVVNPVISNKQSTGQSLLYIYDINFSIVDLLLDKAYGSSTIQVGGTGKTEGQAFMDALRRLDMKKTNLAEKIKSATGEIIAYYNKNCKFIIDKANMLISAKKFDEAFATIAYVPEINSLTCKTELNNTYIKAYQLYTAYNCDQAVQEAKNAWSLNPTQQGANEVRELLAGQQLSATCKAEVNKLITEIKTKLLKEQFDEKAFRNKVFDGQVAIQRDAIKASRDIATEYYRSKISDTYIFLR